MGSFSWNKSDDLEEIENIAFGDSFKFMIPKEFGGGFIEDEYKDYGYLGTKENGEPKYDMYELLACWNSPEKCLFKHKIEHMKEIDNYTDKNRSVGISIGCYDNEIDKLKYHLKLVSQSFKGTYEDLVKPSYGDQDQGFFRRKRK